MSENDLFLKQMKGVKPIKKKNRLTNKKTKIKNKIIKKKTETTAPPNAERKINENTNNTNFSLEAINIRKNIKKNLFKIDKKIDFHGKSLNEAEEIFLSTILNCYNKNKRCLLFVTGKGLFKRKNNKDDHEPKLYHGIIRAAFSDWVKSKKISKYILSFEQASIEHGGDGAFYVYLRKKKINIHLT